MWAFLACSWAAQVAASIVFHVVVHAVAGSAVEAELNDPRGVWRPMTDARMMYPIAVAPLANAAILHFVRGALRVPVPDARAGVALAVLIWLVGPGHGLVVEWMSMKVSAAVTLHFVLSTLLLACVNGAVLGYFAHPA